jgi:hypothetical protein
VRNVDRVKFPDGQTVRSGAAVTLIQIRAAEVLHQLPSNGPEDWLSLVHALSSVVDQWRDTAEHERRMPQPLFEALRDAGLFSIDVPKGTADSRDLRFTAMT